MNIIQQLKQNDKPFGLMSEEMQEKAKEIGIVDNFMPYNGSQEVDYNSNFGGCVGYECNFHTSCTYRLRPDYEEEPEVKKYEVCVNTCDEFSNYLYYIRHQETPITHAPDDPNFVGFLYEDGNVYHTLRLWRWMKDTVEVLRIPEKDAGAVEALTPTHVLFRSVK